MTRSQPTAMRHVCIQRQRGWAAASPNSSRAHSADVWNGLRRGVKSSSSSRKGSSRKGFRHRRSLEGRRGPGEPLIERLPGRQAGGEGRGPRCSPRARAPPPPASVEVAGAGGGAARAGQPLLALLRGESVVVGQLLTRRQVGAREEDEAQLAVQVEDFRVEAGRAAVVLQGDG